jgi:hypothetical protein
LAISCAPELPSGVTKPLKSGETGLVMSMMTYLDCVATGERPAGQGAGHVPQADNADAARGVPAFWSWIGRHAHPVVVNGWVVNAVE